MRFLSALLPMAGNLLFANGHWKFIDYVVALFGIIVFYSILWLSGYKRRYMLKYVIPTVATVVSIEKTMFNTGSGSTSRPVMKLLLTFENSLGENTEITQRMSFGMMEIVPNEGDKINILIDPKNQKKVLLMPEVQKPNMVFISRFPFFKRVQP